MKAFHDSYKLIGFDVKWYGVTCKKAQKHSQMQRSVIMLVKNWPSTFENQPKRFVKMLKNWLNSKSKALQGTLVKCMRYLTDRCDHFTTRDQMASKWHNYDRQSSSLSSDADFTHIIYGYIFAQWVSSRDIKRFFISSRSIICPTFYWSMWFN